MIAVVGANGQLGTAFARILGADCHPVTRTELDLAETGSIGPWLERVRPELVINCAAYTDVDAAESDEGTARAVNAIAVGTLAEVTARLGIGFVTFSTDYVFDGAKKTPYVESDEPNPLSVYGRTKAEGERLSLDASPSALVVRTSWLFSATHPNFVTTILSRVAEGEVAVVDDQMGRPTFVDDLVRGTMDAVSRGASGILHLTNIGETTRYGLAQELATMAGHEAARVRPITSEDLGRPARRPANSVLASERLEKLGISALPPFVDAMREVIDGLLLGPGSR